MQFGFRVIATLGVSVVLAVGCSDDPSPSESAPSESSPVDQSASTTTTTTAPPVTSSTFSAPEVAPTVTGPITGPNEPVRPQPATPLPEGYVEEEFFVGGNAVRYDAVGELGADGMWSVEPVAAADYQTRVLVRRPPAERFSGTVVVEWLNVSAIESSPDWGYLVEEIGVSGHAYVAVSAQAIGVVGGETILSVEVDEEAAAAAGADASDVDAGGLVNIDPERYGTLTHPGDLFAYDMYTQIGSVLAANGGGILGDLEPSDVIAVGESQSAGYLTTYVNAIQPREQVFDGFFVHSRGSGGAPLGGDFGDDTGFVDRGDRIRTDLDVPVFMLQAETDLTLLGYSRARQDDTELIRTWEMAGTSHADAHVIRGILGGPRDGSTGSFLGCDNPINTGPHHELAQAAFRHLVTWVDGGEAPPMGERLRITDTEPVEIVRDELGIALGGVRNPLVDVPVVVTTGDPWNDIDLDSGEGFDVCALFGQTRAIERSGLIELHGSADEYVAAFDLAADAAVADGFLLDYDAQQLREEARMNRTLFD